MRVPRDMLERWREAAQLFLAEYGYAPEDVETAINAWDVAFHTGMMMEAYDHGMHDGHIQTALKQIFPNAGFRS